MQYCAIAFLTMLLASCGTVRSERDIIGKYVCQIDDLAMTLELNANHQFVQVITEPPTDGRMARGQWQLKGTNVEFDRLLLPYPYPSSAPNSENRAASLNEEAPALLPAEFWYGSVWLIFDPDSHAGFKKQ